MESHNVVLGWRMCLAIKLSRSLKRWGVEGSGVHRKGASGSVIRRPLMWGWTAVTTKIYGGELMSRSIIPPGIYHDALPCAPCCSLTRPDTLIYKTRLGVWFSWCMFRCSPSRSLYLARLGLERCYLPGVLLFCWILLRLVLPLPQTVWYSWCSFVLLAFTQPRLASIWFFWCIFFSLLHRLVLTLLPTVWLSSVFLFVGFFTTSSWLCYFQTVWFSWCVFLCSLFTLVFGSESKRGFNFPTVHLLFSIRLV